MFPKFLGSIVLNLFLNYWGVGSLDIRQYAREQLMFMKQVLFSITLAEDKICTFLQVYNPCFLAHIWLFCTLMVCVFQGLLANVVELKKVYISFKLFYDSASASPCS